MCRKRMKVDILRSSYQDSERGDDVYTEEWFERNHDSAEA